MTMHKRAPTLMLVCNYECFYIYIIFQFTKIKKTKFNLIKSKTWDKFISKITEN